MNEFNSVLTTIENRNKEKPYLCKHTFNELTALCPISGLPDFYKITIKYEPSERLVELKSLKMYFIKFRNEKLLHEELANQILDDFVKVVHPKFIDIELDVYVRGGIYTKIHLNWPNSEKN